MLHYNINKNIVRAILTVNNVVYKNTYYSKRTYIGIAKCDPSDKFDKDKGMAIAKKRALKQYYKEQIQTLEYNNDKINKTFTNNLKKIEKYYSKVTDFEFELYDLTH